MVQRVRKRRQATGRRDGATGRLLRGIGPLGGRDSGISRDGGRRQGILDRANIRPLGDPADSSVRPTGSGILRPMNVNVDNFVRAETARMFTRLQADAGGVNILEHNREPASVDAQSVIRMNRDTMYSFGVVDISRGATITIPERGDRYLSAMIVNEDHYINRIFHDAGEHRLTVEQFESPHVLVAARILADPTDADDLAAVAVLQDQLQITAASSNPYVGAEYDDKSLDSTRTALLTLASGLTAFDGMFGTKEEVSPVHHLLGSAAGWGGLPTSEATYIGVTPDLPVGRYELTVGDVPVDGFWSISVYNAEGYFEPNDAGVYSVNSVTGIRNDDGSMTVRFGDHDGLPNSIPVTDGWNYLVRLYRPRDEIINGSWKFPTIGQSS
jgi:hypothetical protein